MPRMLTRYKHNDTRLTTQPTQTKMTLLASSPAMNGKETRHRDPGPCHNRRRCLRNRLYLHDDTTNAPFTLKHLRDGE
jgi:hypothetical protein